MDALKKDQVNELFQLMAVMIAGHDVVPKHRVEKLFGEESFDFAFRMAGARHGNGYGVGDYTLEYINYKGFLIAATYYNVRRLQKEATLYETV